MPAPNLVEVYTASHRITGNMSPGSAGILGYLNMATESFVEVENAAISPLHQVGQQAENCPKIWLMKSDIVAVVVESRADLGLGRGHARRLYQAISSLGEDAGRGIRVARTDPKWRAVRRRRRPLRREQHVPGPIQRQALGDSLPEGPHGVSCDGFQPVVCPGVVPPPEGRVGPALTHHSNGSHRASD